MFTFYERRKLRRVLYSKPAVVVLLLIAVFLGNAAYNAWDKASIAKNKRMEVAAELGVLQAREAMLRERIAYLETDKGKEEELRKQFDVGKDGEYAIVVVEKEANVPLDANRDTEKSFFERILDWF
jgi:cell division protein FtsB